MVRAWCGSERVTDAVGRLDLGPVDGLLLIYIYIYTLVGWPDKQLFEYNKIIYNHYI
jgi:hypothetical protein